MLSPSTFATVANTLADAGLRQVDPEVINLVDRARDGSSAAFAELYDRYVDRVYGFILRRVGDRVLAEDLTADTFTRALRRMASYQHTGSDPIAWLLTIARNRVHDHFRSGRFRLERSDAEAGLRSRATTASPEGLGDRAVVVAEVQAALARLKPDHAEVLHLRFVEDLSAAEVGQVMGRKPGAVRVLQHRALKALAQLVDVEAVA